VKFLTETTFQDIEPLVEAVQGGSGKSYYVKGPFLQSDIKNKNGRIYPHAIMSKEVARYTKEMVEDHRGVGELGHPDSPTINLPLVSHKIIELKEDGKNYIGKAKVLTDMPNGKIVKTLIDENVKLGVSSRGVGSLQDSPEGNVVGEDFYLATAADIVADPSAPEAFVRGIMENREWVWDSGILKEAAVANLKRMVEAAPRKQAATRRVAEAAVWEKFLRMIRVGVESDTLMEAQIRQIFEAPKKSYDEWMLEIDRMVSAKIGLSIHDLPDMPFRDWYDAGKSPAFVVGRAMKEAKGELGF
jgi:hypothetical protein